MTIPLFNQKTVAKLCSKIKPSYKQKNAAKEWLQLLDDGKLKNEKPNYLRFTTTILQDILGFSIKDIHYEEDNIEFSYKNKEGKTILGIEAKGTKTKDLFDEQKGYKKGQETPINQLWTYMGKLGLKYGIATNYQNFVLITRKKGLSTYHFFDFREIRDNDQKLKEFIAIFSQDEIIENGFVEELEEASIIEEREFTKEFYKLYHETRLMLINEFEENKNTDREQAIHFAQLFLNRLMFVFFAEDTGKITKRIIEDKILRTFKDISLFSSNSSRISNVLIDLFKGLDKGSDFPVKLFGFNGGLFKEEISVNFKDFRSDNFFKGVDQHSKLKKKEICLNETKQAVFLKYKNNINPLIRNILLMGSFDFNTEVNVNILGHIFEQSISDIEHLKDNTISKRKKDGIFYTPEYITDYICRNTIIPYLSKKEVNTVPELIKEHSNNMGELESKFKSIKILDPACGSGAFLIKATDVMLEIFKAIQEFKESKGAYTKHVKLKSKRGTVGTGTQLGFVKWNEEAEAREIIENSIHGVDINEESVEITKLSLFLKMARKNRKLTNLSNNIKRGNSLIDDPEVSGDLAFDWEKEFPFKFDIVIGNPPYVLCQPTNTKKKILKYFKEKYFSVSYKIDLFHLFIEKSISITKNDGLIGLITPNTYLTNKYTSRLREYILSNTNINTLVLFEETVFEDASVDNSIIISNKHKTKQNNIVIKRLANNGELVILNKISQRIWEDEKNKTFNIKGGSNKEFFDCKKLGDIASITFGLQTKDKKTYVSTKKQGFDWDNCYTGKNINKYFLEPPSLYFKNKSEEVKAGGNWNMTFHHSKKIVVRQVGGPEPIFAYDSGGFATLNTMYSIIPNNTKDYDEKYILTILNSKMIKKFWLNNFSDNKKLFPKIKGFQLKQIPIHNLSFPKQKPFVVKADLMLTLNKDVYEKKNIFFNRIKKSFELEKINKKLDSFYELEVNDFLKEIEKQSKKKLSLKEQDEWENHFNEYKRDLLKLKNEIDDTDTTINQMVCKLYGLSKEEIEIVKKG